MTFPLKMQNYKEKSIFPKKSHLFGNFDENCRI